MFTAGGFGEINGSLVMNTGLPELFRDTLACLGIPALLRQNGREYPVRMLMRQPESWVTAGDPTLGCSFLSSRVECEIMIDDIPKISVGDILIVNERCYKIFQEPLKDPSGTVWRVQGMIVEGVL